VTLMAVRLLGKFWRYISCAHLSSMEWRVDRATSHTVLACHHQGGDRSMAGHKCVLFFLKAKSFFTQRSCHAKHKPLCTSGIASLNVGVALCSLALGFGPEPSGCGALLGLHLKASHADGAVRDRLAVEAPVGNRPRLPDTGARARDSAGKPGQVCGEVRAAQRLAQKLLECLRWQQRNSLSSLQAKCARRMGSAVACSAGKCWTCAGFLS